MTTQYDIIIIGAGPAGLSFARTLANSPVSITIIEKSPLESIERPAYDGREIALTHLSKEIMERLGMWQRVTFSTAHSSTRGQNRPFGQFDFQSQYPPSRL